MNIENAKKLIEHLEWLQANGKQYKFDMGAWLKHRDGEIYDAWDYIGGLENDMGVEANAKECGTVGCIAGHAALIGGAPKDAWVPVFAREWLDLDMNEADHLFMGFWSRAENPTLRGAIGELRRMVKRAEKAAAKT